jgi:hypothetical protein
MKFPEFQKEIAKPGISSMMEIAVLILPETLV